MCHALGKMPHVNVDIPSLNFGAQIYIYSWPAQVSQYDAPYHAERKGPTLGMYNHIDTAYTRDLPNAVEVPIKCWKLRKASSAMKTCHRTVDFF